MPPRRRPRCISNTCPSRRSPTPPPDPPRRKGTEKTVPQALPSLQSPEAAVRVLAALKEAGRNGLGTKEAAVIAGVGLAAAGAEIGRLVPSGGGRGGPGGGRGGAG